MPGGKLKSGLGAKLGRNGDVKAMVALQGDMLGYTPTIETRHWPHWEAAGG